MLFCICLNIFLPFCRYVEKNVKAHSLYRGYSPDIPAYLHNRPHPFIKQCMSKIHLAEEFTLEQVIQKNGSSKFQVKSSTEKNTWHTVNFDSPSCSCKSWQHNHLPCKHFFAVFRNYPEWGWHKLPLAYTCSPTVTLDENVIPKQQKANSNTKSATPVNDASINNDCTPEKMLPIPSLDSTTFEPASNESMPVRKRAHRNIGSECREILSEIKSMTYLVSNYDDLVALRNELTKLHTKLSEGCPSDCGLLLESTEDEPQLKKQKTSKEKLKKKDGAYKKIPKDESKKHKYAGRVGSKASMMRKLYKPKKNPVLNLNKTDNKVLPKTKPTSAKNNSTELQQVTKFSKAETDTCNKMEFPEWGGSVCIKDTNTSMVNTCPIDNWLVISYIILQLYPAIYKGLSNMVAQPGAKTLLKLYEFYKQKKFNEAKWYMAQLNNLSAHITKEGAVVNFFGNEHNCFVRHIASLFRHTSISTCSNENCPQKVLITDSTSNPSIAELPCTSNNIQQSLSREIKCWFESGFHSQCLLKCTEQIPGQADLYVMEGTRVSTVLEQE